VGKDVVRVRTDKPNRTDYENQNHRQHNRVLSDILAFVGAKKF